MISLSLCRTSAIAPKHGAGQTLILGGLKLLSLTGKQFSTNESVLNRTDCRWQLLRSSLDRQYYREDALGELISAKPARRTNLGDLILQCFLSGVAFISKVAPLTALHCASAALQRAPLARKWAGSRAEKLTVGIFSEEYREETKGRLCNLGWFWRMYSRSVFFVASSFFCTLVNRAAPKGTNPRGQTEPKRRFSLIFADSRLFLENKAFGKRRFSQKTADFRRKPQEPAENRRKPQIGVCPFRFVPLSAALVKVFCTVVVFFCTLVPVVDVQELPPKPPFFAPLLRTL